MIEIRKHVTELGKREHNGQLLDCVKIEWQYDGRPVHVCVAGTDHYVKAEKMEIWIGLDEPESPDSRRYKILAMGGYSIDAVGITKGGNGLFQDTITEEVDVFHLDETKPQIELFGITVPAINCQGEFLWDEDIKLSDYLQRKASGEYK